jgi:outer membrane biosynthesis protein TonB
MAISKKNAFSRRLPDLVTEELVAVLNQKKSFEFKALFDLVHANLRARNAASGGEEMLRLRAYEKLQNLVSRGMVKKTLKEYRGQPNILMALPQPMPPFVPQVPSPNAVVIRSIYAEDYDPNDPILPVAKVAVAPKPEVIVKVVAKIVPKVAPKIVAKPKKVAAPAKKKVSSKKPAAKAKPAKKVVARKPAKKVVAKKPAKKASRRAVAA